LQKRCAEPPPMRQSIRWRTRRVDAAHIVWPRSHHLVEQSCTGLVGGLADALPVLDNL
jgi:hypothetical protein